MAVYLGSDKVGVTKELGTDRLQWKCDNVKSLAYEFLSYKGTEIPILKGLDTSKVTSMQYTFQYCSNVTNLDLSSFDTSNVTTMANMFAQCSSLTSLNLSGWNTSKVTDMSAMFSGCSKLKSFDFAILDIDQVTTFSNTFNGCGLLETVSNLNCISATGLSNIFVNCKELKNITLYNIKAALIIGSGTSYGTKLTLDSLVHTIQQLWDLTGTSSKKLTMSTASKELIANIYVKLVDVTDEMLSADQYAGNKKPCVVCESTDEGAMLITEYLTSKNWTLA